MSVALDTRANERGTYVVTVAFEDEDGASVVPNTITWTLTDAEGAVVNDREEVAVASPAASIQIVLSGLDLAVGAGLEGTERRLLVEWTYDSDLGDDLPGKEEFRFEINDFAAPSGVG